VKSQAPVAKKQRYNNNNNTGPSTSAKFTSTKYAEGDPPTFEGLVALFCDCSTKITHCRGYFVSACPDCKGSALIVLDIPGKGITPCLCPSALLDNSIQNEVKAMAMIQGDKRREIFRRSADNMAIKSVPVHRGNVQGHLLLSGPKGVMGRVVDSCMMASLEGGCLREGNGNQTY